MGSNKNKLTSKQNEELISILRSRFEKNKDRHKGIEWTAVLAKIGSNPGKLWSLNEMEVTGGEPDIVGYDKKAGEYIFYDCSPESPNGRRSICYDDAALQARKENKPKNSATKMAAEMGIDILTEQQYRELQQLGNFDTKTSSWITTPADIRNSVALFFATAATILFLHTTTAQILIMLPGVRGALKV